MAVGQDHTAEDHTKNTIRKTEIVSVVSNEIELGSVGPAPDSRQTRTSLRKRLHSTTRAPLSPDACMTKGTNLRQHDVCCILMLVWCFN